MKIEYDGTIEVGIPLKDVPCGTVVRTTRGDCLYLVISPMDGSGEKHLVTLGGGCVKYHLQNATVIPVDAVLYVKGILP